jgi:hypothetical protein
MVNRIRNLFHPLAWLESRIGIDAARPGAASDAMVSFFGTIGRKTDAENPQLNR